jgi:hypothetical protein
MAEIAENVRRELSIRSALDRFWILAILGGLMVFFTSINSQFSPYVYWPYFVPAVVAIIAAVIWERWRDAPMNVRRVLTSLLVIAGAWLVIGPWLTGFADIDFMPASRSSVMAGEIVGSFEQFLTDREAATQLFTRAFEASSVNTVTLTGAGVGGFILLFSGITGWFSLRTTRKLAKT